MCITRQSTFESTIQFWTSITQQKSIGEYKIKLGNEFSSLQLDRMWSSLYRTMIRCRLHQFGVQLESGHGVKRVLRLFIDTRAHLIAVANKNERVEGGQGEGLARPYTHRCTHRHTQTHTRPHKHTHTQTHTHTYRERDRDARV